MTNLLEHQHQTTQHTRQANSAGPTQRHHVHPTQTQHIKRQEPAQEQQKTQAGAVPYTQLTLPTILRGYT